MSSSPTQIALGASFNADMYLMYNSGLPNSVPVPLGFVAWVWGDSAKQNADGTWSLSNIGSHATVAGFAEGAIYPEWKNLALNAKCPLE
jgi:hypothetical protein